MSVPYQQILRNVGVRMSALTGTQLVGANTTYDTAPLTSAQFKSVDWPFNSFRDAILMAESQFAQAVASSVDSVGIGTHPWRSSIAGVTAALANGALVPATDSGGSPIIGAYGEVVDAADGLLLFKRPWEMVQRTKAETWRLYPLYYFCFVGRRIFHTRTNVTIGVCVYNRVTQLAAFAAGNMLLPDAAEAGVTALAISLMTKDGAFAEQAAQYHTAAAEALALVTRGGVPNVQVAA